MSLSTVAGTIVRHKTSHATTAKVIGKFVLKLATKSICSDSNYTQVHCGSLSPSIFYLSKEGDEQQVLLTHRSIDEGECVIVVERAPDAFLWFSFSDYNRFLELDPSYQVPATPKSNIGSIVVDPDHPKFTFEVLGSVTDITGTSEKHITTYPIYGISEMSGSIGDLNIRDGKIVITNMRSITTGIPWRLVDSEKGKFIVYRERNTKETYIMKFDEFEKTMQLSPDNLKSITGKTVKHPDTPDTCYTVLAKVNIVGCKESDLGYTPIKGAGKLKGFTGSTALTTDGYSIRSLSKQGVHLADTAIDYSAGLVIYKDNRNGDQYVRELNDFEDRMIEVVEEDLYTKDVQKPRFIPRNYSMILARDYANGIGVNNALPWPHNSIDMKWFKENTSKKIVVMGYNTWESLGCKPLPQRLNIVITSKEIPAGLTNTLFFKSIPKFEEWLDGYEEEVDADEIFIIGGATLYQSFSNVINKIYLTTFDGVFDCDTFVDLNLDSFEQVYLDKRHEGLLFEIYKRKQVVVSRHC